MILSKKPLAIAEVKAYLKDIEENIVLSDYIKEFAKLSKAEAEKIAEEIRSIKNVKIKEEHIVKIIDILPQDYEDINKIFQDVSLREEESNEILSIIKKH